MDLKLFSKAVIFTFCCSITFSCSETIDQNQPPLSLGKLDLSKLSIKLNPVTIDLNEYPLDQLLKDVGEELYQIDIPEEGEIVGVSIEVDGEKNQATLTPQEYHRSDTYRSPNEKGTESSVVSRKGWTVYDVCESKVCITNMMLSSIKSIGVASTNQSFIIKAVRTKISSQVATRLMS